MCAEQNREIRLKRRPQGLPTLDDFELATTPVPVPAEGQALVRTLYFSLDPYMRGRMNAQRTYAANFELDAPIPGGCVGQVVVSRAPGLAADDYVLGLGGWREYFVAGSAELTPIDPGLAPLSAFLGVMGMPGATAYFGLLEIGQPQRGETLFVSAASGAVGSIVCQVGTIKGCRVVGSAGSPEKVRWLQEVAGVDAALCYKEYPERHDLARAVGEVCPEGIDIYFENVGGAHLEAALAHMNQYGRIPLCGMISLYNATGSMPGPSNLSLAVGKRLRLQGFIVNDFRGRWPEFQADMSRWIADGRVRWEETVVQGVDNAPQAFLRLFSGEKLGKLLVQVGPDPG